MFNRSFNSFHTKIMDKFIVKKRGKYFLCTAVVAVGKFLIDFFADKCQVIFGSEKFFAFYLGYNKPTHI